MCLGVHGDINRATAEIVDDMDWDNAVVPIATLFSAYLTRETIRAKLGFSQLEHRFIGLKRDDKKAEADIYEIEYQNNALTPNEYRERNNLPPDESEWGDKHYADVQIAIKGASGSAGDDEGLPSKGGSKSKKPSKE